MKSRLGIDSSGEFPGRKLCGVVMFGINLKVRLADMKNNAKPQNQATAHGFILDRFIIIPATCLFVFKLCCLVCATVAYTPASIGSSCEDHIMYNNIKDTVEFADTDVSGTTHWALALHHPASRQLCSKLLRDICQDWVKIVYGAPPQDAAVKLRFVMRVCLQGRIY